MNPRVSAAARYIVTQIDARGLVVNTTIYPTCDVDAADDVKVKRFDSDVSSHLRAFSESAVFVALQRSDLCVVLITNIGKEATLVPLDLSSLLGGGRSREFRIFGSSASSTASAEAGTSDDAMTIRSRRGFGSRVTAIGCWSCGHIHGSGSAAQPTPVPDQKPDLSAMGFLIGTWTCHQKLRGADRPDTSSYAMALDDRWITVHDVAPPFDNSGPKRSSATTG